MDLKSFVYCEWIDDDRLLKALPTARFVKTVALPDHRLCFKTFTEDADATIKTGGCYLEPAPGERTAGLLYEFDAAALAEAERLSRVAQGRYVAKIVRVVDDQGREDEAVAYVIKHPIDATSPSSEYKANMLNGARKHRFSTEYISYLAEL